MSAAAMPAALRPWDWVAPTATAAAFLATPASSAPTGSSETSHTTPERWKVSATRWASSSECEAHTRPAPGLDHLLRVRRPADACDPLRPEGALELDGRHGAVGRHQALGQRHQPRPVAHAQRADLHDRVRQPLGRDGEEDQVGAAELVVAGAERADLEVVGQLDPFEVVRVLARLAQSVGLLLGAAQKRRTHPRAHEQRRRRRCRRSPHQRPTPAEPRQRTAGIDSAIECGEATAGRGAKLAGPGPAAIAALGLRDATEAGPAR